MSVSHSRFKIQNLRLNIQDSRLKTSLSVVGLESVNSATFCIQLYSFLDAIASQVVELLGWSVSQSVVRIFKN